MLLLTVPKIAGSIQTPEEMTSFMTEANNILASAGITPNGSNNSQISQAIAAYALSGGYFIDSGAANAYVVAPIGSMQTVPAYYDGMIVRFLPQNTNTAASAINVATLGSISIMYRGATNNVSAGQIVAGYYCTIVYSAGDGVFYLVDNGISQGTPTPATITSSATLTLAQLNASYLVNATSNNVDIELPLLSTVPNGTFVEFYRQDNASNTTKYRMKIYGGNSGADLIGNYNDHYFYFAFTGCRIKVVNNLYVFESIVDAGSSTIANMSTAQTFANGALDPITYDAASGLFFNISDSTFQPLIRGTYSCTANLIWASTVTSPIYASILWQYNSSNYAGTELPFNVSQTIACLASSTFHFNGTTDNLIPLGAQGSAGNRLTNPSAYAGGGAQFNAILVLRDF